MGSVARAAARAGGGAGGRGAGRGHWAAPRQCRERRARGSAVAPVRLGVKWLRVPRTERPSGTGRPRFVPHSNRPALAWGGGGRGPPVPRLSASQAGLTPTGGPLPRGGGGRASSASLPCGEQAGAAGASLAGSEWPGAAHLRTGPAELPRPALT